MNELGVEKGNVNISPLRWALYIFVSGIPLIGIIMLIIWALDDSKPTRKSWARGMILIACIGLILVIFAFTVAGLGGILAGVMQQY